MVSDTGTRVLLAASAFLVREPAQGERDEAAKAPHATSLSLARTLCPFQSALQQCGDLSSAWCSKGTQHRPS